MKEQRQALRHQIQWNTEIKGVNRLGIPFIELCLSSNLSVSGVLLPLKESLLVGSKVSILIEIPSYTKSFMQYSGEVARIVPSGVGIKFDDTRPSYVTVKTASDSVPELLTLIETVNRETRVIAERIGGWMENMAGNIFRIREEDLLIEIHRGMSAGQIEEKIIQLKIFAKQKAQPG